MNVKIEHTTGYLKKERVKVKLSINSGGKFVYEILTNWDKKCRKNEGQYSSSTSISMLV